MSTVYADITDGYVAYIATGGPTWASVRDAGTGTSANNTLTRATAGMYVNGSTARGGAYQVYRSFFAFDTSGITSVVSSATLKIHGYSRNAGDVIAVRATAPDLTTGIAVADFDAIHGFVAGASMNGNATDYSAEISTWSTSGYNDITLTADALSEMVSESIFKVALVNYDYDYLNVDPTFAAGVADYNGCFFANASFAQRPYIDYTLAGYPNAVNGVATGDIGSIIGVDTADIDKVIGS